MLFARASALASFWERLLIVSRWLAASPVEGNTLKVTHKIQVKQKKKIAGQEDARNEELLIKFNKRHLSLCRRQQQEETEVAQTEQLVQQPLKADTGSV